MKTLITFVVFGLMTVGFATPGPGQQGSQPNGEKGKRTARSESRANKDQRAKRTNGNGVRSDRTQNRERSEGDDMRSANNQRGGRPDGNGIRANGGPNGGRPGGNEVRAHGAPGGGHPNGGWHDGGHPGGHRPPPNDFRGWHRGPSIHPTYRNVWIEDVWYDEYGYPCYSPAYIAVTPVPGAVVITTEAPPPPPPPPPKPSPISTLIHSLFN